ncbi:Hydrolase 2, exosortase A system-associated [Rubrivivax sp. A210]|uniref:hydrolase 2, exosortase A system-associated n=1 Tax=Rubrivivax sp. A210 TaxID=2772301 RepID=UPI0019188A59|nr:hydrolase 2, exosortase A system-associated [Rubrivivax sp. A210]CAD5375231.1 Hydrolase 2, exosortase A system-associated [Rubrivivax sp. A210]
MTAAFEAFFAPLRPGPLGQRLCLWHAPPAGTAPTGLVVHVHGFAEEMNKSRRMAAWQARELAAAGHAVLQFDLLGCGDSAGDFGDASWSDWVDDVVAAAALARTRHAQAWPDAQPPGLWLWGHRMGCLLANAAAPRIEGGCDFLFWQPTPNGKTVLQQFLRLETAAALMGKATPGDQKPARERLAAGETVDVAGYRIQPALAQGLEAARLQVPARPARLEWIDVSPQEPPTASPVAQQNLAAWQAGGCQVRHQMVQGPAFWQTTEIEDAPALIAATVAGMKGEARA